MTAPPSELNQLAEFLKLEHQFLRVPFEHYKKTIRTNHRIVEKEMSAVISGVLDANFSREDAVQHLNSLISRLQGLKRKMLNKYSCVGTTEEWVWKFTHNCWRNWVANRWRSKC